MAVEKITTTRNHSIDVLRILACLAVVMIHVVSSFTHWVRKKHISGILE